MKLNHFSFKPPNSALWRILKNIYIEVYKFSIIIQTWRNHDTFYIKFLRTIKMLILSLQHFFILMDYIWWFKKSKKNITSKVFDWWFFVIIGDSEN